MRQTYSFDHAQINLCGIDLLDSMSSNILFVNDDIIGDSEINLYLVDTSINTIDDSEDSIDCETDYDTSNDPFCMTLTNTDSNVVVCKGMHYLDEYDYSYTIKICNSKHDLKPGHYRLTLENMTPKMESNIMTIHKGNKQLFDIDGHTCHLNFIVAEDGKHLKHPYIQSVKGRREDKSLLISMACKPFDADHDLIGLQCFNSSLTRMAHNDMVVCGMTTKSIEISMTTHLHWCDDTYKCIVCHNLQPFACVEFAIRNGKITGMKLGQDPLLFDYVRIGNTQMAGFTYWHDLTAIIAQHDLKRKAVEGMKWNRINEIRHEQNLPIIARNHNHVLLGDGSKVQLSIAETFSQIDQKLTPTKVVDAAELCRKRNAQNYGGREEQDIFADCGGYTFILFNTTALTMGNGPETGDRLKRMIEKEDCHVILTITGYEWNLLKDTLPDFCALFDHDNIINTAHYTTNDLLHVVMETISNKQMHITSEAADKLLIDIGMSACHDTKCHDTAITMVDKHIMPKVMERWIKTDSTDSTITVEDIDLHTDKHNDTDYDESMRMLNDMTGLKGVKETLNATFNKMKLSRMRECMGLAPLMQGSHHMVFTGNPGTGKTTVARMMGRIMKALGVLTKGDVVVAERKSIIGQYIGDTEENMKALLQRAKGNVLFIDEAYTLCTDSTDKKDYGQRAIECLLTVMAQKNADMVIIMAGYENEMERMMSLNEGLRGRFSHWIRFEDYNTNELHDIGVNLLQSMQMTMTDDADSMFRQCIAQTVNEKDSHFSNARWVEQFVQTGIMPMMADRIISCCHHDINAQTLQTVTQADIERAFAMSMFKKNKQRQMIGFR